MTTLFPGNLDAFPRPSANTKRNATGFELHSVIDNLSDATEAIETLLGSTPAATDRMLYVRISDGAGKGLYVPIEVLGTPDLVDNPNFDHFQRTAGSSVTTTTTFNILTSFAADAIFVRPFGASVTQQRSSTVPTSGAGANKSRFSLAITGAASVTDVDVATRFGTSRMSAYGRQPLVFEALVRNESGAAYTPTLLIGAANASDDFTTINNRLSQSLQSCADSAWTLVYHAFDPTAYSGISNGMEVCLRIPSGSSVSGDINRIAYFSVRPGTQLMDPVGSDPRVTLLRCLQRYAKTFLSGTAVAQNSGSTNGALEYVQPVTASPFAVYWQYPLPMQKIPSIVTYNPAAANAKWRNHTDTADSDTPSVVNISDGSALVYNQALAGDTAGDRIYVHATANAEWT